jgi:hypothetical protein
VCRRAHHRFRWFRFGASAFALCLMVVIALHAPVAVASTGQHTAGRLAGHLRQPCLDLPGFDWTVPHNGPSLVFQSPERARLSHILNPIAYCSGPAEFRLYNRPPPLS